ncbi:hypothetical protein ACP275_14G051700 [Erythranthe tilingii]
MATEKRSKTLPHLPQEIIEEILYKLPVKTLFRFKCVSKRWRSLISSKKFAQHHLKKSRTNLSRQKLIILNSDVINRSFRSCSLQTLIENSNVATFDHHRMDLHTADRIPMSSRSITSFSDERDEHYNLRRLYNPTTHYPMMAATMMTSARKTRRRFSNYPRCDFLLEVLGSCNGLLLVSVDVRNLILWNPTTRQAKNISPPENRSRYFYSDDFIDGGSFVYGLGYDESTEDYKVVCFFVEYEKPHNTTTTMIYSSRANSWKRVESFEKGFFRLDICGTFVNGKLHWMTEEDKNKRGRWDIVSLDLAEEKYETVGPPQSRTHYRPRLHDLGGCLSLTSFDRNLDMDVWVMTKKCGETEYSWTRVWKLCRDMMLYGHRGNTVCPLWLTRIENGDIVVTFGVSYGLNVVVYSGSNVLHTSRVRTVDDPSCLDVEFEAKIFVESLVSPFGDQQ